MSLISIPPSELITVPRPLWGDRWLLLTAGDWASGRYNAMTVSWGTTGVLWERPVVEVVVRPTRHTRGFIDGTPSFTLCGFPEKYRGALSLLGSRSGRDGDKIGESGLTPIASPTVEAPRFAEADLVLECRKIYWHDVDPGHFIDPALNGVYPLKDYHRAYIGEIAAAWVERAGS